MASSPVDLANLRQFLKGNKEEERYFAALFLKQSQQVLQELRRHCTGDSSKPWCAAAHLLKSSAATIGARKLCRLCEPVQSGFHDSAIQRIARTIAIEKELQRIGVFFRAHDLLQVPEDRHGTDR